MRQYYAFKVRPSPPLALPRPPSPSQCFWFRCTVFIMELQSWNEIQRISVDSRIGIKFSDLLIFDTVFDSSVAHRGLCYKLP